MTITDIKHAELQDRFGLDALAGPQPRAVRCPAAVWRARPTPGSLRLMRAREPAVKYLELHAGDAGIRYASQIVTSRPA